LLRRRPAGGDSRIGKIVVFYIHVKPAIPVFIGIKLVQIPDRVLVWIGIGANIPVGLQHRSGSTRQGKAKLLPPFHLIVIQMVASLPFVLRAITRIQLSRIVFTSISGIFAENTMSSQIRGLKQLLIRALFQA
jgi:hypothetical protein